MNSVRSRIFIGIAVPVLMTLLIFGIALSLPTTDARFIHTPESLLVEPDNNGPAVEVVAFHWPLGYLKAYPELAIDEPDVIETYPELNRLFADIQLLTQALTADVLVVETTTETTAETTTASYRLTVRSRTLSDLPTDFWIQVSAAFVGLLLCTLVWLPGQVTLAKAGFILTGVGYFLLATSAGIYSSRNLFIASDLFQPLSLVNLLGTNLFMGGLSVLLWNYPKALVSVRTSYLLLVLPLLTSQLAVFQVFDELALSVYLPFTCILAIAVFGMVQQFRNNADNPKNRAALRWILLFMTATTIPAVLKLYTDVPQSVMIASFVFVYAGMMIAVTRHQMFDIERWSYKLWGWFLGGMAVLLADVAIASAIGLSQTTTLAVSLAVIGWLYFPVRQMLWRRFFMRRDDQLQDWLTRSLPELLRAHQSADGVTRSTSVINALKAVFSPLSVELQAHDSDLHTLEAGNNTLRLANGKGQAFVLSHPAEGRRTFRESDLRIGELVLALNELVQRSLAARAEGAQEERARIRQDLHDDLGAKLLRLLHRAQPDDRPLVKEAIQDLRTLLQNNATSGSPVSRVLHQWQAEADLRCQDHNIPLTWHSAASDGELSAVAVSQVSMALREALSNAIRYRSGGPVSVTVKEEGDQLQLRITNLCEESAPEHSAGQGMGLRNLQERMQRTGGTADVSCDKTSQGYEWSVILTTPLAVTP